MPPTIIEIFQSQSYSAYHVTYWDHSGWRDTLAHQIFNDRQHDYVKRLGLESGACDEVSKGESRVRLEVDRSTDDDLCEAVINVFGGEVQGDLDLWLVKYDSKTVEVEILAGENQGRRPPYRNVVKSVERIGFFEGEETDGSFFVDLDGRGTFGFVVLVRQGYGGPVVCVAEL
jgi:hypothetical protein